MTPVIDWPTVTGAHSVWNVAEGVRYQHATVQKGPWAEPPSNPEFPHWRTGLQDRISGHRFDRIEQVDKLIVVRCRIRRDTPGSGERGNWGRCSVRPLSVGDPASHERCSFGSGGRAGRWNGQSTVRLGNSRDHFACGVEDLCGSLSNVNFST